MKTYEFTIILGDADTMSEELASRLYEAGCSDGSPFSADGIAAVEFDREAASLEDAIKSAITDVEKAGCRVAQRRNCER